MFAECFLPQQNETFIQILSCNKTENNCVSTTVLVPNNKKKAVTNSAVKAKNSVPEIIPTQVSHHNGDRIS